VRACLRARVLARVRAGEQRGRTRARTCHVTMLPAHLAHCLLLINMPSPCSRHCDTHGTRTAPPRCQRGHNAILHRTHPSRTACRPPPLPRACMPLRQPALVHRCTAWCRAAWLRPASRSTPHVAQWRGGSNGHSACRPMPLAAPVL
jgi:hypothetical protein